ncbi:MAG: GTP 3',8-cyclase MoaA [Desulfobacterales bacterium]|nr:GTP 3',8-cyclase MoaA [Desulfobacteraceae bacterium]MBT7086580.1 GTP 3',8-cyclase MoaA [Desulfobacterales bacterium]MBT7696816.1 GTP 3',8-cyclase MoaA [Desulfobacterales bacterium]
MEDKKLLDDYSRNLNYLRVSITDRCNLRCMYCEPRRLSPKLSHADVLSYEEILRLIEIGVDIGINKVRVTGGDPLVRKGVYDFLDSLGKIEGIVDTSLTTNGVLLFDNLQRIKAAGIKRINVSLDTLDRQKFETITGRDQFAKVWQGIMGAHEAGFGPIKLNTVVLNGINDDEVVDLARLSFTYPFHIRFIEYMPIGNPDFDGGHHMLAPEIKEKISVLGKLIPVGRQTNDGPSKRYKFEGSLGEIGFIRPLSRHFCGECNRLRITASGYLRPCLLSDYQKDLKTPLRSGCSDSELADIFFDAVHNKPGKHDINDRNSNGVSDIMSSIGG